MTYGNITNLVESRSGGILLPLVCAAFFCFVVFEARAEPIKPAEGMGFGIPVGGVEEDRAMDICPRGVRVINMFLAAWNHGDHRTMYELLDDSSKTDYSYEDALFDFQFMEFKPYTISSARKAGDDYEFVLSCGDWRSGDKEVKKLIISGETYKIKTPSRGVVFKESVDSYF